jgi:hypothetical protein
MKTRMMNSTEYKVRKPSLQGRKICCLRRDLNSLYGFIDYSSTHPVIKPTEIGSEQLFGEYFVISSIL